MAPYMRHSTLSYAFLGKPWEQ